MLLHPAKLDFAIKRVYPLTQMPNVIHFCKVANGMGWKVEDAFHHHPNVHNIKEHFRHALLFTNYKTENVQKQ